MSYQVLARKYRSQSFTQLVGQNHISQTLLNALRNNRLPHALLFTGLRGTGKTSSARILAKSLRCQNAVDFTPCNTCDNCVSISNGSSVDVIEIDGASNNGVDAIRDLRDNVMFMPSSGKYKIFIIDEVHMLSTSAFNALLKTLEEPPAHVIFIMATTEVHKIPQTILSRCQRFDFRRIPIKQLTDHLKFICQQENIKADEKSLWLIAQQGDGSARDSITLLDQVINFASGDLNEQQVASILGLTDRSLVFGVFEQLIFRKQSEMTQSLVKINQTGVSPALFLEELLRLIRHSLVLKAKKPDADVTIDLPQEEIQHLNQLTQSVSDPELHMLFDMGLKSLSDVSKSFDPLLVLEVCLLRMVQAPQIKDLKMIVSSASNAHSNQTATSVQRGGGSSAPSPKFKEESLPQRGEAAPLNPKTQTATTPAAPRVLNSESLLGFVDYVKKSDSFLGAKLNNLIFGQLEGQKVTFQVKEIYGFLVDQLMQPDTYKKVQGFIDSYYGVGYAFNVIKTKSASGDSAESLAAKKEAEAESKIKESWIKDSRVQKAQQVFNGTVKLVQKN